MATLTKQLCTWSLAVICLIGVSACNSNNDAPTPRQTENLTPIKVLVSNDKVNGHDALCGVDMYFNFTGDNDHELLRDTRWTEKFINSDWYFEVNGKQYRLGDTMEIEGNSEPVRITGYMSVDKYILAPTHIPGERLKNGPITYSYSFVWPEKGINKKIEIYAEYNENFEKEKAEMLAKLSGSEVGSVVLFNIGYRVDGKPMESPWADMGLYTIPIEE